MTNNISLPDRSLALASLRNKNADWNSKYPHYANRDRVFTVGEVENERLRMAGRDECPMYEPDYNEGWK